MKSFLACGFLAVAACAVPSLPADTAPETAPIAATRGDALGINYGQIKQVLKLPTIGDDVRAMAVSNDGRRIVAVGSDLFADYWLASQDPLSFAASALQFGTGTKSGRDVELSIDQASAYLTANGALVTRELSTGLETENVPAGSQWIGELELSSQGVLAFGEGWPAQSGLIRFRDMVNNVDLPSIDVPLEGYHIASYKWSPDGSLLAVSVQGLDKLRIYDVASQTLVSETSLPNLMLSGLAWFGNKLALAHTNEVSIFDVSTPAAPSLLNTVPGHAWYLAFSPDGEVLAGVGDSTLTVWNASTGAVLLQRADWGVDPYFFGVRFSPGGSAVLLPTWFDGAYVVTFQHLF